MHPGTKRYLSNIRRQHGATLVLSLLLVAILTILSVTAMQSSYLSFKSQISRLGFQRNVSELNLIQLQAASKIRDFIDSRDKPLGSDEHLSEGFLLLDEILAFADIAVEEEALTRLLSYFLPQRQVEVYITKSRLSALSSASDLLQYNAYEYRDSENLSERRYLYLQLHCIEKSTGAQSQGAIHIVGDFRFEV